MIELGINHAIQLLRSIAYIFVAIEAIMLAQLYYFAYVKVKGGYSGTIKWLFCILCSLGLFFLYMALLPVIRIINVDTYLVMVNLLVIAIIPLIISLQKFRQYTLNEDGKNIKKVVQ